MTYVCCGCRSLPVHSAVCSQSWVWWQDSPSRGHCAAVSSENEERLDTLGQAADWNLWGRYDCHTPWFCWCSHLTQNEATESIYRQKFSWASSGWPLGLVVVLRTGNSWSWFQLPAITLPGYFWVRWLSLAGKLPRDVITTQVNSASHPFRVAKSGKGVKVTGGK